MKRPFRPDAKAALDDELQFHFDQLVAEGVSRGLDEAQAREEANRRLGNLDDVRTQCGQIDARRERAELRALWLGDLRQDLALALRQLLHRPAFTAGVVLTLALGIGANLSIFGAIDALVLRPLREVAAPRELVVDQGNVSLPALRDFRDRSTTLLIAGFSPRRLALEDGNTAAGLFVSGAYFDVLRARPLLGRLLGAADDAPGAPVVAVASYHFWLRDPSVLGKSVRINGVPAQIVGVARRGFRGTRLQGAPDLWIPVASFTRLAPTSFDSLDPEQRTWGWLSLFGRLRDGATLESAQSELNVIAAHMLALQPDQLKYEIRLLPAAAAATGIAPGAVSLFSLVLAGVVLLVLLLACANVANLLLARGAARRREIAVRIALGATRSRVLRQLLAEALLLALLGGALGLALAGLATGALSGAQVPGGYVLPDLDLLQNGRVLAFAIGIALSTTILFGLPPALQATRLTLVDSLKEGVAGGRAGSRLRDLLLIAQVSISLVLLVGAGLFLRGLERGLRIDPGFSPDRLAFAAIDPGLVHHGWPQAQIDFREIERAVSRLPGVRAVSWSSTLPLSSDEDTAIARPEGYTPRPDEDMWIETQVVSDSYLDTMGLKIVAGRALQPHEPQPVMLISRSAGRRWFASTGAVGKHIRISRDGPLIEVVGVAADARYHGLEDDPRPLAYLPLEQAQRVDATYLLVRTGGDTAALSRSLRRTIQSAAPGVPVLGVGTLDDQLRDLLAPQRMGLFFLGAFAALGLLLAFVGTASVTAFALAQQTHELGIRLALGADGPRLLRMVLAQTLRRLALALLIGGTLSAIGGRALGGLLYGLPPTDPVTFSGAGILLLVSGLLAALVPARKVLRIDPTVSLRSE